MRCGLRHAVQPCGDGLGAARGRIKLPYYVVSEGHHVASGKLNRYTFQPGITDVKSQVISLAPWISKNLGKKVTMIYPDFAFGYDHRDYFSAAIKAQGGEVIQLIPIPPTRILLHPLFPTDSGGHRCHLSRDGGAGGADFRKRAGRAFGSQHPALFGFIDSLEAVDLKSPGLEFLDGSYLWEAYPRYAGASPKAHDTFYRGKAGGDAYGASASDASDVPPARTCSAAGKRSM